MPGPVITGHTTTLNNGTLATFSVNPATNLVGSAVTTDDWIIVVLSSGGNNTNTKQPSPPAGWTNLVPFGTVGTGTMCFGAWAHQRAGGETTYTWSQTTSEANTTYTRMLFVSGADDIANWITGATGTRAASGGTTLTTAPSITTTSADTLALLIAGERTVAAELDAQVTCDNFTKDWFDNSIIDHSLFVASKDMTLAGATGTVTVTYPNIHAQNGIALIFGIPAAPAGPEGLALKISNGTTLDDAYFKLADGAGGFVTPGDYKVVRPGYSSVVQMLAQTTFYVAHRGGSRDFPEMSLYAYGQSALIGFPALEMSVGRSLDGVFFGLHDDSLDRTSGVSGVDHETLTWTQIQASYEILGSVAPNNPTQSDQPYMRFEELMDIYYGTHVIFIDPKYLSSTYRQDLLDLMDSYPSPTTHFVGKYYGVSGNVGNTTGHAKEFADRGYSRWGYFYEADSANYVTYAPRWDILGLDYNASQTAWDDLAAAGPGRPIMGHICPNPAAVTTALGKGADGVMVSGVASVLPPAIT